MSINTNITIGGHFSQFVENKIKEGRFETAGEAVRAGLHLLEVEESRLEMLRTTLAAGKTQSEQGLGDIIDSEIIQEAIDNRVLDVKKTVGVKFRENIDQVTEANKAVAGKFEAVKVVDETAMELKQSQNTEYNVTDINVAAGGVESDIGNVGGAIGTAENSVDAVGDAEVVINTAEDVSEAVVTFAGKSFKQRLVDSYRQLRANSPKSTGPKKPWSASNHFR